MRLPRVLRSLPAAFKLTKVIKNKASCGKVNYSPLRGARCSWEDKIFLPFGYSRQRGVYSVLS